MGMLAWSFVNTVAKNSQRLHHLYALIVENPLHNLIEKQNFVRIVELK